MVLVKETIRFKLPEDPVALSQRTDGTWASRTSNHTPLQDKAKLLHILDANARGNNEFGFSAAQISTRKFQSRKAMYKFGSGTESIAFYHTSYHKPLLKQFLYRVMKAACRTRKLTTTS